MLHYISGHHSLKGGLSRFADAYAVALEFQKRDPEAYNILCTLPVAFQYSNDNHWRYAERPTIELDGDGKLAAVNYSPPFQAPVC